MEIPGEKEDVDVFVSPRRFVGRTPGAKAFRKKVFEDNQKKVDEKVVKNEQNGSGFDLTEVKYDYELGGEKSKSMNRISIHNTQCILHRSSSKSIDEYVPN